MPKEAVPATQLAEVPGSSAANGHAVAGDILPEHAAGAEPQEPRDNRSKRSRRRHASRAKRAAANPEMRHMRPPVTPTPVARYVPAKQARDRGDGTTGRRARGRAADGVFAALDLGTNNCRLLVAVPAFPRGIRVIDAYSRIVRLGEGLSATGRLGEAAMDRAVGALRICASKLAGYRVAGMRLIATEACRSAANGAAFLERVASETGLHLEVVDRGTEARLAAEGCGELMDRRAEGAVLFDIGGGSSELILVNRGLSRSRRISSQIAGWTSLPMGVVTLAERHGGRSVTPDSFEDMVGEVIEALDAFEDRQRLADIWAPGRTHLLGTSGTVTTIAGVHLDLRRYDRRRVDGIWLSDKQIDKVIGDLLAMDYEERARNPCIGRERADLVLAGCAILQAIRRTWPSDRLRVADRGLREGILSELMRDAGVWRRRPRPRNDGIPHTAGEIRTEGSRP